MHFFKSYVRMKINYMYANSSEMKSESKTKFYNQ